MELYTFSQSLIVVSAYAPTENATESLKDTFEDELVAILEDIPSNKEVLLMGDLNAITGSKQNDNIVGKYGEQVCNKNGERLINLCSQMNLKIMNGFYRHKDIHNYTWTQPTRNFKSIIDYVILRQKTHLKCQDVRVLR